MVHSEGSSIVLSKLVVISFCLLGLSTLFVTSPAAYVHAADEASPSLMSVIDSVDASVRETSAQVQTLQKLLDELRRKVLLQDEIIARASDIPALMSRIAALEERVVKQESANTELEAQLIEKIKVCDDTSKMLEELRQRYDELAALARDAAENAQQLDSALILIAMYEETITQLEDRVAQLEVALFASSSDDGDAR